MTYSPERFTNNVFKINRLRCLSDPKLFSEFTNSFEKNTKRDEYLNKKKNTQIFNFLANQSFKEAKLKLLPQDKRFMHFTPDAKL